MLTRAAKRFDARFAAMPPEVQRAVALAMYRAAPAIAQYRKDLEPLAEDPEIIEAIWDLMIAVGVKVGMKGRRAFSAKTMAELAEAAPVTFKFAAAVTRMINGVMPSLIDVAPAALPPLPDAEALALMEGEEK